MCSTCLKILETRENEISSKLLCSSCLHLIRHWNETNGQNAVGLTKAEEKELRQIIELVLEEFQDHFGHALNLSMKQMTQHLLSNINLFYNHYQHEFEQLAKKYRFTFLDRFLQLMNKKRPSISSQRVKTNVTFSSFFPSNFCQSSDDDHKTTGSFVDLVVERIRCNGKRFNRNDRSTNESIDFNGIKRIDVQQSKQITTKTTKISVDQQQFVEKNVHIESNSTGRFDDVQ